jgi:hypothetical protein
MGYLAQKGAVSIHNDRAVLNAQFSVIGYHMKRTTILEQGRLLCNIDG